jgi:hypothetical protein
MHYTLCDLIADLTQNSAEAKAKKITVELLETDKDLTVYIRDDGKGMSPEVLQKASNPFYTDGIKHPKRKIGMGIPFLIQTASDTGGFWDIQSKEGEGTTVTARFDLTNIDTPPIGDVPLLFRQILTFPGGCEMQIIRKKNTKTSEFEYDFLRSDLIDALGGLETAGDQALLLDFLQSQEDQSGD